MTAKADKPLTGRTVLMITVSAFAVIIGVNLTLAYQAVATFPGLETSNSYVASQTFDADRKAQLALDWDARALMSGDTLRLQLRKDGMPVQADIQSAILGRATQVADDQELEFVFDGQDFVATVIPAKGNWNLRLVAQADDGTTFRQRMIVKVTP
ncbi:FixH family protein [Yoonia sp.]|uniref:FixH family protein n=1 Tax=Yoonia sp. TaxID=2212373 RepID=UPI003F6CD314